MALTLEVTYADRAALKHALESQLARGGLYVAADASALPPLCELTLRVCADEFVVEAPARLTVATAEAACVEIAASALAALVASVGAYTAEAVATAGQAAARIVDSSGDEASAASTDGATDASAEGATGASADGATDASADGATDASADGATDAPAEGATDAPTGGAPDTRGVISLDRKIAVMAVGEKIQLALHGNREARQLLMRDRAGVVQSSLVRNPKMTLDEVQALARAPQLAPDTAEMLATHPIYGVSPQIAMALVRNPRTPLPTATQLIAKLSPSDLRVVAKGLGVRSQVAAVARKRLVDRG